MYFKPVLFLMFLLLGSASADPRNLLIIVADDHGLDNSFLNTNPAAVLAPTPRLEQLAAQGVTFTKFRSAHQCSQTRAALLTGRHGYRTGVIATGSASYPLKTAEYTYADDLNSHGYATALFGKWALHAEDATNDAPRIIGGYDHFSGLSPITNPSPTYSGYQKSINGGTPFTVTEGTYLTTDETNDALAWIGSATAPWACQVAYHAAHNIVGFQNFPYPPSSLHDYPGVEGQNGGLQGFCAIVQAMDREMARLLATIDFTTTTVVYFGDNGSLYAQPPENSEHGKSSQYDNAVKTPLIIAGAGVVNPGRRSSVMCSPVDLYQTLLKHVGGWSPSSPNTLDGFDFSGVLRGEVVPKRKAYTESGTSWRCATDGDYRLVDYYSGATPDLFFNLKTDPTEISALTIASLTGPALKSCNDLRYFLIACTNKTAEQAVIMANYSAPSVTTGGIVVKSGGVSVTKPTVKSPATITAPLKTGATVYTLWKRTNPFASWVDTGISPVVGATVVFTDPTPIGRVEYRITNDSPEP